MSGPHLLRALAVAGVLTTSFTAQDAKVDFARDVQPILRQQCYGCHGPAKQTNGFRLDRRSDAMRGSTNNVGLIRPGNSGASLMLGRISGADFGPQMPPTGALRPEQIATIKAWIDQGAEWPDALAGEAPVVPADPSAVRMAEALRGGDMPAFRTLAAADPKIGSLRGPGGSTPLMYAVLYGDVPAMTLLLDGGADPNVRNDAGATALMWAVTDVEKTRLLLDRGAAVNARSEDGRTALLIAAGLSGGARVVSLLLDRGADIAVKAPGMSAVTNAVAEASISGDAAVMRLLVDRGADTKAGGPDQIAYALRAGCVACAEMLFASMSAADVTAALQLATPPFGPGTATGLFLRHGADPDAKDPGGRTLLMRTAASEAMPVDAVRMLVARGADVNATNAAGDTALAYARRHGKSPVAVLLEAGGAHDLSAPARTEPAPAPAASPRAAIERSVPLLQRTDAAFLKQSGCVSCHSNTLTAMTVAAARQQHIPVNEEMARQSLNTIGAFVDGWRERLLQGISLPGDADAAAYTLLGMAAEQYPPDAATDAMVHFLRRQQLPDGRWRPLAHRPPIESSDVQATASGMRAVQLYAPKSRRAEYDRTVRLAANWIAHVHPANTQDRAFQLLGLKWSGTGASAIRAAARGLAATQQSDGGWAQLPTLGSDAYATGQALVALQESGAMSAADPAYQRGVSFLLTTQFADGSWLVKTRAIPLQPRFDVGFPHDRDQWVSVAATNWAAMALARAGADPHERR